MMMVETGPGWRLKFLVFLVCNEMHGDVQEN